MTPIGGAGKVAAGPGRPREPGWCVAEVVTCDHHQSSSSHPFLCNMQSLQAQLAHPVPQSSPDVLHLWQLLEHSPAIPWSYYYLLLCPTAPPVSFKDLLARSDRQLRWYLWYMNDSSLPLTTSPFSPFQHLTTKTTYWREDEVTNGATCHKCIGTSGESPCLFWQWIWYCFISKLLRPHSRWHNPCFI